ncbi:O-antigen ligase family protein [Paraclostridium sordellii]|uniref:O-antigen ligase family protein n=1 Tax=Paraclostridium sordellii TaxID=1505 RepID=UPI0022DED8CA|nr:O-antigen ligase family protein [Paeniclostridium sordellii]
MINKSLTNKIKYYLLILFVVIQPILDIHYLYTEEVVKAIGFSPSTIIRMIIIGILGILTILTLRDRKSWIFIGIYLTLVGIYTIFHILNARDFYTLVPNDLDYSVVGELFYIIRMLIPMAVIFMTMTTEISKKDYEKAIKIILLLISLSIIISNIFKFSLTSYGKDIISGNIFDWFKDGYSRYNYLDLASRGPFNSANQLSALLCLLLPTMFGIYTYDKKISNLLTILLTILAMVMIGTKVALYGAIIVVAVYILMIVIAKLFKQDILVDRKIFLMVGLSIIILSILYAKSPSVNRELVESGYKANTEREETKEEAKEEIKSEVKKEVKKEPKKELKQEDGSIATKQGMVQYVEENFAEAKIKHDFITQCYPYQYDPEFWIEIMGLPVNQRTDYRFLELKMHQRVMDINDNPNDKWLGISFTRTEHLFTLERDFIYQYYSLGLIGVVLFLGPYVLITLGCLFRIIIKSRENFNVKYAMTCFGTLFILAVSVYSGNIMDALTITIILAFILGKLVGDLFIDREEIENENIDTK